MRTFNFRRALLRSPYGLQQVTQLPAHAVVLVVAVLTLEETKCFGPSEWYLIVGPHGMLGWTPYELQRT